MLFQLDAAVDSAIGVLPFLQGLFDDTAENAADRGSVFELDCTTCSLCQQSEGKDIWVPKGLMPLHNLIKHTGLSLIHI